MDAPSADSNPSPCEAPRHPKRWRQLTAWLLLVILSLAFLRLVESRVVPFLVTEGLKRACPMVGFRWEGGRVSFRLGSPLILRQVELGPMEGTPGGNLTKIELDRVEIALGKIQDIISNPSRPVARLSLRGIRGTLDWRTETFPPLPPLPSLDEDTRRVIEKYLLVAMPLLVEVKESSIEILADDQRYALVGIQAALEESVIRTISVRESEITAGPVRLDLGFRKAKTAWKDGVAYISGLELDPGLALQNLWADLTRWPAPRLGFAAEAGGGWVRGEASFLEKEQNLFLETMLWGGNLAISPLANSLNLPWELEGELVDLFFDFRGFPDRVLEGETAFRVNARDFLWDERGWRNLHLAGRLTQSRLVLDRFTLDQEENRIEASGSLALAENLDLLRSELTLQVSAQIQDLKALAALAGPWLKETSGALQIEARLQQRGNHREGTVTGTNSDLVFRGLDLGSGHFSIRLTPLELILEKLEQSTQQDFLQVGGSMELSSPHRYSAELQLKILDLSPYLALFLNQSEGGTTSGGINLSWQGDGTAQAHSGAFQIALRQFQTESFPLGMNLEATGTYSPDSAAISRLLLTQGFLRLDASIYAGISGISVEGLSLTAKNRLLASGQIYLPWDPGCLLRGESWEAGILRNKNLYAGLRSAALELSDLYRLLGQEAPLLTRFQWELQAGGALDNPVITSQLRTSEIRASDSPDQVIASSLQMDLESRDGRAELHGKLLTPWADPVQLEAGFPLGLVRDAEGSLALVNPMGELSGSVTIPATNLANFQSFAGRNIRSLGGILSGHIVIGNTLASPSINGKITLRDSHLGLPGNLPDLSSMEADLAFEGSQILLQSFSGESGAGRFNAVGQVDISNLTTPQIDLRLRGDKVLLYRDPSFRLRANFDITAKGTGNQGEVKGRIGLVDGRIYRRIEITPLIVSAGVDEMPPPILPALDGMVPHPFSEWKMRLEITNDSPFVVTGNIAAGEIEPEIRIDGTLGDPRPTGSIALKDLRAYLPFTVLTIPEGYIYLREDNPRVPSLDIRGYARALDYDIRMAAFGPLDERNLLFRSDPPLPQDQLILLLTTGLAPGVRSGAGFGEAAIGQGGMLLARAFVRQFEPEGVDLDSILNRLNIRSIPPTFEGERAGLQGEFRINDSVSILTERDGLGYYNFGASYRIRFR
jgi:hypothetical protein